MSFEIALAEQLEENKLALPVGFNSERFVRNVVAVTQTNESLNKWCMENQKTAGTQIIRGAMQAAYLGLDFMNKEAYLIPYGKNLQFTSSYTGMKKLCKKYAKRQVKDIYAKVVREGDEFIEQIVDGEPSITFNPKPFSKASVIGAFAVALFEDGGMQYETMNINELEKARKASKMGTKGAWATWPEEMQKKVVIRRLCKSIELDFDNAEQVQAFEADTDIDNSVQKQVEIDIEDNANKEEFVIDAEAVEKASEDAPF